MSSRPTGRQRECSSSYSHGLPGESGELHFISLAIPMYVHNGTNITGLQALSRNIARQHYGIVFFDHSGSTRYAVMSRRAILASILLHME
jgi:hypothetical protein